MIGLSVVHDLFFFHGKRPDPVLSTKADFRERARKVNIWAFTFLLGPFLGPFISSFLLSTGISWRLDFGVLAMFYGVSAILVVLLGEETLYDREKTVKPTAGSNKVSILLGIAGAKAKGQSSLISVAKDLLSLLIKPQLLFPSKHFVM